MDDEKTKQELEILNKIFSDQLGYCEIIKSEQPDFILTYTGGTNIVTVGTEITKLYFNDTSARLANKKDYIKDLIEGNYIHKNDKSKLNVRNVKFFAKEKNFKPFDTKMLFLPNYTIKHYHEAFLRTLRNKSKKFSKYNKNINQCSLIIYDSENFFKKTKHENFTGVFFNPKVLEEIRKSPFNEIYLIVTFSDKDGLFVIQLKCCYLLNEAAKMLHYLSKQPMLDRKANLNLEYNEILAEILLRLGFQKIKKTVCNNINAILCDRYAIGINEVTQELSIFDNYPKLIHDGVIYSLKSNKNYFKTKSFKKYQRKNACQIVTSNFGFKAL